MTNIDPKKIAAEKAVEYVQDGMIVGLGTGTTAYWAIQKIGECVKRGMKIQAVASSEKSADLAEELNIPVISFDDIKIIDLTIDGADEIDKQHHCIKGGGGALLREKILATNSKKWILVVDSSKMVNQLGRFPLPVEIVPFASNLTISKIQSFQCEPVLRKSNGRSYITDNGNFILDCKFREIADPVSLNAQLHAVPGVVETGLFVGLSPTIVIGYSDGKLEVM